MPTENDEKHWVCRKSKYIRITDKLHENQVDLVAVRFYTSIEISKLFIGLMVKKESLPTNCF